MKINALSAARMLVCLLLAAVASSCFSLAKEAPVKRRFGLKTDRETVAAPASAPVCLVRNIEASSVFDGRGLVYRTGELTYDRDFYHEYFAPPAALITSELRRWVQAAGIFRSVVGPGSYAEPDYFLEGEIVALHGDYSEPVARAVVGLNLLLLRRPDASEAAADPILCFQREFLAETPLGNDEADVLVQGLVEALTAVLQESEGAVREVVVQGK